MVMLGIWQKCGLTIRMPQADIQGDILVLVEYEVATEMRTSLGLQSLQIPETIKNYFES